MNRKHRETKARIHRLVSAHMPGAKVQRIAARKTSASVVDLGGHEIDHLKVRAAEWFRRHGLVPAEDIASSGLAAPVDDTSAALSRIVLVLPPSRGVIPSGASRRGAVRAVVLATNTNQVLGEQG